ncbi:prohibitin family protein [Negadavirga shengliensis]|uniref:Prohibitin family protein n=1 Tax=Negadavirga shengliensis TaxID=1389218 RepID=A0ABV9SWT8_9BACT
MKTRMLLPLLAVIMLLTACAPGVVRQGEVGVKRKFGKLSDEIYGPGMYFYNPVFARFIKTPVRTNNLEVFLNLPSKEGLTIQSEISILYRVREKDIPKVITEVGETYEMDMILPVFRSAAADISARFMAKDMHTAERATIENAIKDRMDEVLGHRGFEIESVLMKSIRMPAGLSRAIEEKLTADQEAQRMEFVLQKEKLEAERRRIEAEGKRDAQKIIAEGLTREIIELRSLETLSDLANSSNTKIIISDGKTPYFVNTGADPKQ